ncbi:MAG TPA: DUF2795 domain-containing protein [Patescibacteria group bacterium]
MPRGVGGKGPANIMRHLKGVHFPATRQDLIEHVESKDGQEGYPDTAKVLEVILSLPDEQFSSMSEVMHHTRSPK